MDLASPKPACLYLSGQYFEMNGPVRGLGYKVRTELQHQWWCVNDDGSVSPSRSRRYAIGYNKDAEGGSSGSPLQLVDRADERKLIFQMVNEYVKPGFVVPLTLKSHKGKAICID